MLRDALNEFKPDLVLIWGDDQFENYKKTCVPAFALGIFDELDVRPFGGGKQVFQTTENVWNLAPETPLHIRGHRKAASELARHLIEDQFDIAYSLEFSHPAGLAHSFNNTVLYLDYEAHGETFGYPIIPCHVNCYGSDLMKTAAGMIGEGENVLSPPAPGSWPSACCAPRPRLLPTKSGPDAAPLLRSRRQRRALLRGKPVARRARRVVELVARFAHEKTRPLVSRS